MDYLELYLHPSVHVFVFDGWIQFIPTDTEKNLMDPSRMEFPLNYFYPSYTKYRQQLMFGLTIFLTFSILLGFYLLWNTEGSKWCSKFGESDYMLAPCPHSLLSPPPTTLILNSNIKAKKENLGVKLISHSHDSMLIITIMIIISASFELWTAMINNHQSSTVFVRWHQTIISRLAVKRGFSRKPHR